MNSYSRHSMYSSVTLQADLRLPVTILILTIDCNQVRKKSMKTAWRNIGKYSIASLKISSEDLYVLQRRANISCCQTKKNVNLYLSSVLTYLISATENMQTHICIRTNIFRQQELCNLVYIKVNLKAIVI